MSVELLAIGAHPDDVEIGVGGILSKHSKQGYQTAICDLTKAERSSNGTIESRMKEAEQAQAILGVSVRKNLELPDRGLQDSSEHINAIAKVIRQLQPTVVLAPHWDDRHPDHVKCSQLVKEAIFQAKLSKIDLDGEAPHHVKQLYFFYLNGHGKADMIVDVTETYEQKMKALQAYESQFTRTVNEIQTPINDPHFFSRIRGRDLWFGHQIGTSYGEGLVSSAPLIVEHLV